MLNPTEKERLKNRDALTSKAKANLDYRVAQKIKKHLSTLGDVNEILNAIPEKNAMRAIRDVDIAALFALTETILRLMRISPVGLDFDGNGHVMRFGPSKIKYGKTEFHASMEPATSEDVFHHFLVIDHIHALQRFIDLHQVVFTSDITLRPLAATGRIGMTVCEGLDRYRALCRKGLGPDGQLFGFD